MDHFPAPTQQPAPDLLGQLWATALLQAKELTTLINALAAAMNTGERHV